MEEESEEEGAEYEEWIEMVEEKEVEELEEATVDALEIETLLGAEENEEDQVGEEEESVSAFVEFEMGCVDRKELFSNCCVLPEGSLEFWKLNLMAVDSFNNLLFVARGVKVEVFKINHDGVISTPSITTLSIPASSLEDVS